MTAPALLITATAQLLATGVDVYMALFFHGLSLFCFFLQVSVEFSTDARDSFGGQDPWKESNRGQSEREGGDEGCGYVQPSFHFVTNQGGTFFDAHVCTFRPSNSSKKPDQTE